MRLLRNNPNVEYVEVDQRRYPMAQTKPYGIGLVQADDPVLAASNASVGSTVCIIDSGYYLEHEDLQDANVTGSQDPGTGNWYEDSCGHGTHVAGTVSALDNAIGVVGVNRNGLLGMHIEKVFDGAACGWTYSSDIIAALNRCQDAVAGTGQKLVVNMSLSGTTPSVTEESAFQAAYDNGVLSVAAAGNGGSTSTVYPAGYPSVISVAAVDSNGAVASFSQRNSDVELAAPGVARCLDDSFQSPGPELGRNDLARIDHRRVGTQRCLRHPGRRRDLRQCRFLGRQHRPVPARHDSVRREGGQRRSGRRGRRGDLQ